MKSVRKEFFGLSRETRLLLLKLHIAVDLKKE